MSGVITLWSWPSISTALEVARLACLLPARAPARRVFCDDGAGKVGPSHESLDPTPSPHPPSPAAHCDRDSKGKWCFINRIPVYFRSPLSLGASGLMSITCHFSNTYNMLGGLGPDVIRTPSACHFKLSDGNRETYTVML